MASEDAATVRAEIKAWERGFHQENQRNPTVDDIRANHQIANKYRLYKKLSKATPSLNPDTNHGSSSARSSTPPRKTERFSVISKSRALETTSALSSYNPFSPQKDKGKQKAPPKALNVPPIPFNPFGTPSKTKPKARSRGPSPSLAHEIAPESSTEMPPEPPTAIARARKRLRGDPVSPSPNKDKRRRMLSRSNISRRENTSSDDEDDEEGGNSSFVADSPVKTSSSKSFMSLFEDASNNNKVKTTSMRTTSTSSSAGLFGCIGSQSVPFRDDLDNVLGPIDGKPRPRPKTTTNGISSTNRIVPRPRNDNLYATRATTPQPSQSQAVEGSSVNSRTSGKRIHADLESESEHSRSNPSASAAILIPPSPPRGASSQRTLDIPSNKGKKSSRKKTKLEDDAEDDEEMDNLSDLVKVLPSTSRSSRALDDDYELDAGPEFDPVFWYNSRQQHPKINSGDHAGDTFEVDLPDKLKHVLALSSSDIKLRDIQEEKVVQSLIYGQRTTRYEPSKGGEIWDIGDVDDMSLQEEDNDEKAIVDDWEGEPVPWEVGEL